MGIACPKKQKQFSQIFGAFLQVYEQKVDIL